MRTSRTSARLAAVAVAAAAIVTTGAATADTASAATGTFSQPGGITINDGDSISQDNPNTLTFPATSGPADIFPSTVSVPVMSGVVSNVSVYIDSLSHAVPDDIDLMLVGPAGQRVMLMSDAGGATAVSGAWFYFDDAASAEMPDDGPLSSGVYRPTDFEVGADAFSAPAPSAVGAGTSLAAFNGTNPAGTWSLYAMDDTDLDSGSITDWSLDITLSGPATPSPSTLNVNGLPSGVTDVDLELRSFDHTYSSDVDVMLVGPQGQRALVMSDAGGSNAATNATLTLDDEAAAPLSDSLALTTGSYQPANYDDGDPDVFDGASSASAGSALSVFDGTNPNGTWKLYVADDAGSDVGDFSGGWSLTFSTVDAPGPATLTSPANGSIDDDGIVTFAGSAPAGSSVQVRDGSTVIATTTATGAGNYSVTLAGVPNGTHSYSAWTVDGFGNNSAPSTPVSVTVDSVAPQGHVMINFQAAFTRSRAVTLTALPTDPSPGTGVTQMRFSNDGKTWTSFEPYTTPKPWTLTAGDGTKTVWAQFADRAGKVSATVADSIVLDTVKPKVTKTGPAAKATGVKVGRNIVATLSEAVRPGTVTKRHVYLTKAGSTHKIRATVTYKVRKHKIVINPRKDLAPGTSYRVTITTKVKDLAGNHLDQKKKSGLQPKRWKFTTA